MRELVLHVGVHKTGSTLLQRVLARSRRALEHQGLRFFARRRLYDRPRFRATVRALQLDRPVAADDLSATAADIRSIVHEPGEHVVLVSDETFLAKRVDLRYPGPVYSTGVAPLRWFRDSIAAPAPLRVIMFVRRQDRFIESMYVQLVHQGCTDRFADWFLKLDTTRFDWLATARRLEGVVGTGNLVVRPFEQIAAGAHKFCEEFLTLVAPSLQLRISEDEVEAIAASANRSLSARGIEVALSAYPLLELDERVALRRSFLQPCLSNRDFPRAAPMSERDARTLLEQHASSNQALFERYMGDFDAGALGYLPR